MEIVEAQSSHIPQIVELWKEFMDFHRGIEGLYTRSAEGHLHFEKYVRDLLASEDTRVYVALVHGKVVAYSIATIQKPPPIFEQTTTGFISDVMVTSAYRRQGIGGQLLKKMVEWFDAHDVKRIELRVVAQNEVGYSFWRKQGFRDKIHTLFMMRE